MELKGRRLAKQISLDWSRTERVSLEFTSTERGERFAEKQESLEDRRQQTIAERRYQGDKKGCVCKALLPSKHSSL